MTSTRNRHQRKCLDLGTTYESEFADGVCDELQTQDGETIGWILKQDAFPLVLRIGMLQHCCFRHVQVGPLVLNCSVGDLLF